MSTRGDGATPLADRPDTGGISMLGFDIDEVGRACAGHGWSLR
jgi:hypothetical protein